MIPIAEALADIGAPVSPVPYRGTEDAFVVYQCIGQTGQIYAEGVEAETGVAYAVDIFTGGSYVPLMKKVKAALEAAGWNSTLDAVQYSDDKRQSQASLTAIAAGALYG